MFKHTVKYKDFNGVEHTEDLYFHLSTPDFVDLQFNPQVGGDMGEFIKQAMAAGENRKVWILFKLLVINSYGRRSEDGANFVKKPEFTEQLMNSNAWEAFFEWLLLDSPDGKHGNLFWEGILPDRIKNELPELEKQAKEAGKKKLTDLSREELERMYLEKIAGSTTAKVIEGTV